MRPASRLLVAALLFVALLASSAAALTQARVASLALPTTGRPVALAESADGLFLVGAHERRRYDELFAIDIGADGRTPSLSWSLDVGARINGIAVDGGRAYLATADDAAELIVVDLALRQRVASFDAPGIADGWSVSVEAPGRVDLVVRRNAGPERYRLAVDAEPIAVLETADDPSAGATLRPEPLRRYRSRGRLIARTRHAYGGGALHYLLATERRAQFQVVEEIAPVRFADLDGDGVYRLGCVGDSNTSSLGSLRWCEMVRDALSDPDFAVVNVAVEGATVNPNLRFSSDATLQMAEVLPRAPDALVLSFGTNDFFQGRTPQEILAAYLLQEAVADAAGLTFYVATTPPMIDCMSCAAIEQGNDLLRTAFAGRVLEFHTGFGREHFVADRYHCSTAGQRLRAERALTVLGAP